MNRSGIFFLFALPLVITLSLYQLTGCGGGSGGGSLSSSGMTGATASGSAKYYINVTLKFPEKKSLTSRLCQDLEYYEVWLLKAGTDEQIGETKKVERPSTGDQATATFFDVPEGNIQLVVKGYSTGKVIVGEGESTIDVSLASVTGSSGSGGGTLSGGNSGGNAFNNEPVVLPTGTVVDGPSAPKITSVEPKTISIGDTVTIKGSGFGKRDTKYGISLGKDKVNIEENCVYFGGVKATEYIFWSDTYIVCRVPKNASISNLNVCVSVGGAAGGSLISDSNSSTIVAVQSAPSGGGGGSSSVGPCNVLFKGLQICNKNFAEVFSSDFNSDGRPDVAGIDGTANVTVFLQGINSFFETSQNYAIGAVASQLTIGDYNNDGKTDLATCNHDAITVTSFLNNGNGIFTLRGSYAGYSNNHSICSGDFNNDGKQDLNVVSCSGPMTGSAETLLGNGLGDFSRFSRTVTANPHLQSNCTGDFNNDGKLDLAVANGTGAANIFDIMIGNGTGNFTDVRQYNVGEVTTIIRIRTANLNNDGNTDLIAGGLNNSTEYIYIGNGDGTFTKTSTGGGGNGVFCTGDFNGDNISDLASGWYDGTVYVQTGKGNGTFNTPLQLVNAFPGSGERNPGSTLAEDFDKDGKLDCLFYNATSGYGVLIFGKGDGTFHVNPYYTTGTNPYDISCTDFNGDGKIDIAASNDGSNTISIFINNGAGVFTNTGSYSTGTRPLSFCIADYNQDGKMDISSSNYSTNNITVLFNNGSGVFTGATNYTAGTNPQGIISGDFNGDGKSDIACSNRNSSNISVLMNNASGVFANAVNYNTIAGPIGMCVNDFNKDGKTDIAYCSYDTGNVSLLMNSGTGTFTNSSNFPVGTNPHGICTADFNGDGRPDIACCNYSSNNISILINNGNGTFAGSVNYTAGTSPVRICSLDFNNDGKPDIACCNNSSNSVTLFLNNGSGVFSNISSYLSYSNPSAICTGDFDADGRPDIACSNYNSNNFSVLFHR